MHHNVRGDYPVFEERERRRSGGGGGGGGRHVAIIQTLSGGSSP